MPIQDFLITFRADTTQALKDINALAARVQAIDRSLNAAMGRLNSEQGGPLGNLAQGAGPAAAGMQKIDKGLLNIGRTAKLTKNEISDLQNRLHTLITSFNRTNRAGRGFQINQGQVKEAIQIVDLLRRGQAIGAAEANKWAGQITQAYAKVANVPKSLRALPISEQNRFVGLRETGRRQLQEFNRLQSASSPDFKAQQTALTRYIGTLREMSQFGVIAAKDMANLEQKLVNVSAAASLSTQQRGGARTIDNLRNRMADQTGRVASFAAVGDSRGQLAGLKALERTLIDLTNRGDPLQNELAQTRAQINALNQAALKAKGLKDLLARRGNLDARMLSRSSRGLDNRDLIRASIENEKAIGSFNIDPHAATRLQSLQAQFASMPRLIEPATQRMLDFNRTLQSRVTAGEALRLPPQSAQALTKGLTNGLELTRKGFTEGAEAVEFFAGRVAELPPTLGRAAQGMLNHGRRVAEGLFIYEAFGRAMQAVGEQIQLVNNLAREEIRFGAVAGGLGAGGQSGFLQGLTDVAVSTNTPLDQLAGQLDSVASAFLDAGDASKVAAESQIFLDTVGQATNITQRDLATETENLIGIYKTFGGDASTFADKFGQITVAGRNSSEIIKGTIDVLSEAGRSAVNAGIPFEEFTAIASQMVQALRGTMSGSEVGGLLNTMLGKLTDPDVITHLEDIVGSVFELRDATGALRPGHEILVDLFAAIKTGKLDVERGRLALDEIVPPLSPATRALIETTFAKALPEAMQRVGTVMQATKQDAKDLSDALVSGPGERFEASMKAIQGALTGIFTDEIISAGNTFADILKSIASILGAGGGGGGIGGLILGIGTKILIFAGALKAASFAFNTFRTILGTGAARMAAIEQAYLQMTGTTIGAAKAAQTAGTASAVAAGQMTLFGTQSTVAAGGLTALKGAAAGLGGALKGVLGVAKSLLPILLAMAAIELPGQISESFAIGDKMDDVLKRTQLNPEDLSRAIVNVQGPAADINKFLAESIPSSLTSEQKKNLHALAEAMTELASQGKLTADTQKLLEDQIIGTNGAIISQVTDSATMIANVQALQLSTDTVADSTSGYTAELQAQTEAMDEAAAAEAAALAAAQTLASLNDERAAALRRLNEELSNGTITLDEWSEANDNSAAAAQAASDFVAAYADNLSVIPGLQERMAATGKTAAEALFEILMSNSDTIGSRIDILDQMVEIADTNRETAEDVAEHPIALSLETRKLLEGVEVTDQAYGHLNRATAEMRGYLQNNKPEPEIGLQKLKAQLRAALVAYAALAAANRAAMSFDPNVPASVQGSRLLANQASQASQGEAIDALERAIAELTKATESNTDSMGGLPGELGNAFNEQGGIKGDDPRLGSAKEPAQTGLLDIDTLPASVVAKIVAAATTAQRKIISAGGTVDTDETTAIFKDNRFLQLVKGIDQRLLQKALEELTEVERRRLELEQQRLQDVTRSMSIQTGPIQSIVSAPVLSAGGGALTGQGLNADPRMGNFTINVPINWSGMSLSQLQQFIFNTVAKAYSDAQRGG